MFDLIPIESLGQGAGLSLAAAATWTFIRLASKLAKLTDTAIEYLTTLQGHQKRTEAHQERTEQLLTHIAAAAAHVQH